jgi:DNA-directed RNA polymerase subunit M/transcription elongation factor TFIIS
MPDDVQSTEETIDGAERVTDADPEPLEIAKPKTQKKRRQRMRIATPEPMATDVTCPKCHAMNATDRQRHIMRVADERGLHHECSVCGTSFHVETAQTDVTRG